VRKIVREETQEAMAEGRVTVEERLPGPGEAGVDGGNFTGVEGSIEIKPSNPAAASLYLDVFGETVGFGPGANGAHFEFWPDTDPEWDSTLRKLIRCLKDGRYSESVERGRVYALKVEMRFGGVTDPQGETYRAIFRSLPEPVGKVREGEHSYPAW
jgi:hypothetical protein